MALFNPHDRLRSTPRRVACILAALHIAQRVAQFAMPHYSPRFRKVFLGSSAVEHPTVNRTVVGSNPTRGASVSRQDDETKPLFGTPPPVPTMGTWLPVGFPEFQGPAGLCGSLHYREHVQIEAALSALRTRIASRPAVFVRIEVSFEGQRAVPNVRPPQGSLKMP